MGFWQYPKTKIWQNSTSIISLTSFRPSMTPYWLNTDLVVKSSENGIDFFIEKFPIFAHYFWKFFLRKTRCCISFKFNRLYSYFKYFSFKCKYDNDVFPFTVCIIYFLRFNAKTNKLCFYVTFGLHFFSSNSNLNWVFRQFWHFWQVDAKMRISDVAKIGRPSDLLQISLTSVIAIALKVNLYNSHYTIIIY